jgi:hypothetical protein
LLNEVIKTGLRTTFVHHHSGQIKDRNIIESLTTNARAKVVFGGITYEDGIDLVNNYLIDQVNERMIKESRYQWVTKYKLEKYEDVTESEHQGERRGESKSRSRTRTEGETDAYNDSWVETNDRHNFDGIEKRLGGGMGISSIYQTADSIGHSVHFDQSELRGRAVKRGTRYAPHQERELTGNEDYTREERVSKFAAQLMNQKPRNCVVLLPHKRPKARKVPPIKYHKDYFPESENFLQYERELNRDALPSPQADLHLLQEERRFLLTVGESHETGNGNGRPRKRKTILPHERR